MYTVLQLYTVSCTEPLTETGNRLFFNAASRRLYGDFSTRLNRPYRCAAFHTAQPFQ